MVKQTHNSHLRALFVDQFNFSSLLRVVTLGRAVEMIVYFEDATPPVQRVLPLLQRLGLIRVQGRRIQYHLGQVRNDVGETEFAALHESARALCWTITQEHFSKDALIQAMAFEWAPRKVLLYFNKLLDQEVRTECLRVRLMEWMLRTQLHVPFTDAALLIRRNRWTGYLRRYAGSYGIHLMSYGSPVNVRMDKLARAGWRLFMFGKSQLVRLVGLWKLPGRCTSMLRYRRLSGQPNGRSPRPDAVVAIQCRYRELTFDQSRRSELFWIDEGVPESRLLVYDYVAEQPLSASTLEELNRRGVRVLGRGAGVPAWYPTWQMSSVLCCTVIKITLRALICLVRGQRLSFYCFTRLLALAVQYSYWYDFFSANSVRLNVGPLTASVSQVLALDTLGGVSISYQFSTSNICAPATITTAGENVQFVFSSTFRRLWQQMEAPADHYVTSGFIYDGAIRALRGRRRITEVRERLHVHGARFIICFFDENSADRWDSPVSDQEAAADYEYLLTWLLADPTLGIVCKPKRATTLSRRIAPFVAELLTRAQQTGRCEVLASKTIVSGTFPAEAALMADVCIGKILGSTAALEAYLVGIPTILLDTEGFRAHPFHAWGRGTVVFNDWKSLRDALEQYRSAPDAHRQFGDWSPGLNDLDPFQDGHAAVRIGRYISWVYGALNAGAAPQQALGIASDRFAQRWGAVSCGRSGFTQGSSLKAGEMVVSTA